MAAMHSIRVDLPEELYQQVREAAKRSDQPLETVLLGSLALLFGNPPGGWNELDASIESLPDEQLRALVYRRMAWPDATRLRELAAQGEQVPLTEAEQAELEALIDEADRYVLLRSRALLLLKGRGHDIEALLLSAAD